MVVRGIMMLYIYPVGNVDVENGGPAMEDGKGELVARSYNTEDYVLDTVAQYPGDPTLRQTDVYGESEKSVG